MRMTIVNRSVGLSLLCLALGGCREETSNSGLSGASGGDGPGDAGTGWDGVEESGDAGDDDDDDDDGAGSDDADDDDDDDGSPVDPEPPGGTAVNGENSWLDLFDYGDGPLEGVGPGYEVYEGLEFIEGTTHSRVDNHWVVEYRPRAEPNQPDWTFRGGGTMRPNRSFKFEDGKFVIEGDVAAGFGSSELWPELTISTGPQPSGSSGDLYGFTQFAGYWAVGCRIQATRVPVCAMYSPDYDRVWEISFFQVTGTNYGGEPGPEGGERDLAWRECDGDLAACRDRFRLELTRDSLSLYVNGVLYFAQTDLPPEAQLPDEFLEGDIYAYFMSWGAVSGSGPESFTYHWDRVAVNPPF